jgi:hypothetical protein
MGSDKAPTAANPVSDLTGFVRPRPRWRSINDPRFANIIVGYGGYRGQGRFHRHVQQRVNHDERFIVGNFFLRLRNRQKRQSVATRF